MFLYYHYSFQFGSNKFGNISYYELLKIYFVIIVSTICESSKSKNFQRDRKESSHKINPFEYSKKSELQKTAFSYIIYQPQQIQMEIKQQQTKKITDSKQIKVEQDHDFEILQDHQQQIAQDIIENYEQDFDQESHHSQNNEYDQQRYIQQQFPQQLISEIEENELKEESKQRLEEQTCDIEEQCTKLRQQIENLHKNIKLYYADTTEQQEIQRIIQTIEDNHQYLLNLEQQKNTFFQTKLGRESFSINHINTPQELDEKLIEQIEKSKMIVNLSLVEIGKLKREIKKNEQYLPNQEVIKEELYQKYKRIKKEIDQKKDKYQQNYIKEQNLDDKIENIKEKLSKIDQSKIQEAESLIIIKQQLQKRHLVLQKKKQTQAKKNHLLSHQLTTNFQSISREISDLKRQISFIQQKTTTILQKNEKIEIQSEKLMSVYQKNKDKVKISPIKISQKVVVTEQPLQATAISQRIFQRGKIRSEPKNSFAKNISNPKFNDQNLLNALKNLEQDTKALPIILGNTSSQRITQTEQEGTPIKKDFAQHLGSNNIRPFKLKLPSYSTQKSNKNLNSSLDVRLSVLRPKINKTDISKLSITQRLQRIENLQKQDRMQSYKLYQSRSRQQKVNESMSDNINHQQGMRKQIFSVQQFSSYSKQTARFANKFLKDTQRIQRKSTTVRQNDSMASSQIIKNDENQCQSQHQEEALQNSTQISVSNRMNSRQSKYFKKRIASRQKKISQDYMRILQQKGRKILQLDSENEV